jgi:hypothetical protein
MIDALTNALLVLVLAATLTDTTVQRVNDRRSAGHFSQLDIVLELPKVKSSDVAASRVLVSNASDETGRDLIDHENQEPQLETNHRVGNDAAAPVAVSLTLKNPARAATKVKEVRGEIELYMPSKDPNSTAEVAKFLSFSGKPLAHKALKANAVEIALVSPAQLAAEKKKMGDAKRKEYAEAGYEGETLDDAVKSYLENLLSLQEGDLLLRVKDPNKRIQEIVYVDGAGEVKRASMRDEEGFTLLSTWGEAVQPDWKLRVSMRTAKNLVRYAFALKDVPLP